MPTVTIIGIEIEKVTVQKVEVPDDNGVPQTKWFGFARFTVLTAEGTSWKERLEGELPANIKQKGIGFYQAMENLAKKQVGL